MFEVCVADNFLYMDQNETYTHGDFATWSEAVGVARQLVDACLSEYHQHGMTVDALLSKYKSFGDDPYIVPVPDREHCSAWEYVKQRCMAMCS